MTTIKLSEWCNKSGIAYITAYRWFKADKFPVPAYQTESGTILVEDVEMSTNTNITNNSSNDAMSLFLKKTVEFSKNNSSIEDFAAYIVSNFQLRLNGAVDIPRYSKNKPQSEEVQKHFKQFLPDKEKAEHLKAFKASIKEHGVPDNLLFDHAALHIEEPNDPFEKEPSPFIRVGPDPQDQGWAEDLAQDIDSIGKVLKTSGATVCGPETTTESLVTRSVDCNTTPQQINYTGSTSQTFSGSSLSTVTNSVMNPMSGASLTTWESFPNAPAGIYFNAQQAPFQPTQKETLTAAQVADLSEEDVLPKRRGRKPSKVNK